MEENKFKKVLKALGFSFKGDILCLELTAADGSTLTVEREEGVPEVGDAASPDGVFTMPDGSTITVAEGVITEIAEADTDPEGDPEPTTEARLQEALALIDQLSAENISLKAGQMNAEDRNVLSAVRELGGRKVLAKMVSTYKPQGRAGDKKGDERRIPSYRMQLSEIKNKQKGN